jgi:ATP-dependent protease HslVU (ClpYQ) peptidase subunit
MSVVIAIKEKDRIYMGCDSQVTIGSGKRTLKSVNNFKIWKVEDHPNCLMGGVGNFRDLCFIRCTPGIIPETNLLLGNLDYPTVVTQIVPAIWQSLVAYGLYPESPLVIDENKGTGALGSQFLIGCGTDLFSLGADGTVEEIEDYIAIGSGDDLALGSLKTTEGSNLSPEERIAAAIDAAARGNAYVSNPIIVADTASEGFSVYGEEYEQISSDHLEEVVEETPTKEKSSERKSKKTHNKHN